MSETSEILREALVSCGEDYEKTQSSFEIGSGVFLLLNTQPTTIICDLLARKLQERGFRVIKLLEITKTGEN